MGRITDRAASAPWLYFNTACHVFYLYECTRMIQPISTAPPLLYGETLTLTRIERDRLVIFDPHCAPLIRPLLRVDDLLPWHTPVGAHWVIVAPATGLPPRLAQHLDAVAPPDAPASWWAMAQTEQPKPRLLIRSGTMPRVSWDLSNAVIAAPMLRIAPADPFQLALLGSQRGLAGLQAADPTEHLARLAAIDVPTPTREHLGALALQRVEWARTQQQSDADYARRLLADFGPPGASLSLRLEHWWELHVQELFEALEVDLRNGVPTEFQPFYAQRHVEALAARIRLNEQIAEREAMLDALATQLWEAVTR
jgi:hypothetical protein